MHRRQPLTRTLQSVARPAFSQAPRTQPRHTRKKSATPSSTISASTAPRNCTTQCGRTKPTPDRGRSLNEPRRRQPRVRHRHGHRPSQATTQPPLGLHRGVRPTSAPCPSPILHPVPPRARERTHRGTLLLAPSGRMAESTTQTARPRGCACPRRRLAPTTPPEPPVRHRSSSHHTPGPRYATKSARRRFGTRTTTTTTTTVLDCRTATRRRRGRQERRPEERAGLLAVMPGEVAGADDINRNRGGDVVRVRRMSRFGGCRSVWGRERRIRSRDEWVGGVREE